MRGTDVTQDQMDAAQRFLDEFACKNPPANPDTATVTMPWNVFVQIIAWYGAIRANGVAAGYPPDAPGHVALAPPKLRAV